ncbi:MAG: septal ring lytic transglycosylase RlpA family protein [Erythrobacter sp.]
MKHHLSLSLALAPLVALALGSSSANASSANASSANASSDSAASESASSDNDASFASEPTTSTSRQPPLTAQFKPFSTPPSQVTLPPGAVDLTTFDPPLESEPVLDTLGSGVASYYGRRFHGRLTANGERFNMNAMTAAHKTLPFGTRVRVTNPRNGRSVTVRINDRGPFIRGRTIDLSRAAARKLGIVSSGHASVDLDVVAR